MKSLRMLIGVAALAILSGTGCTSVKAWQKMYLNDPDMALQQRTVEKYEMGVESYREGASGASGGKTGGGCGCN